MRIQKSTTLTLEHDTTLGELREALEGTNAPHHARVSISESKRQSPVDHDPATITLSWAEVH